MKGKAITLGLAGVLVAAVYQDRNENQDEPKWTPNRADEPKAEKFSLRKAVAFTDAASRMWMGKYRCVTCHTNGLYLVARGDVSTGGAAYRDTRAFARDYLKTYVVKKEKPKGRRGAIEGVVATTSFLTISDMKTAGRLDPVTRQSLDYIFEQQRADGSWPWCLPIH